MIEKEAAFKRMMEEAHSAAWEEDWEHAANLYSQALEIIPDHPKALVNLGLALYELKDYQEALLCYQRASEQVPNDPLPWDKIADIYSILNHPKDASKALIRSGEIYLKNRSVHKAIQSWEKAAELNPDDIQIHSRLAVIYERIHEDQEAVNEYLTIASILQSKGELEKAIQTATHAQELIPGNMEIQRAIALLKDFKPLPRPTIKKKSADHTMRMQSADTIADEVESSHDEKIDPIHMTLQKALMFLADMVFEGPDTELEMQKTSHGIQAIMGGAFRKGGKDDRQRALLHVSQVINLQTNGDYQQAAKELKSAIDSGLEHPAAYYDLGYLYKENDRLEKAIKQLNHAVTHSDFSLGARLLLGEIYERMERFDIASTQYLEALRLADSRTVSPKKIDYLSQVYESIIDANQRETDAGKQMRLCENIHDLLIQPDWMDRRRPALSARFPHRGGKRNHRPQTHRG